MLTAIARGTEGNVILVGLDPRDIAHLTANQPIQVEGASAVGIDRPIVMLFETDPMVAFYGAQPWAITILIRQSTLDAFDGGNFVKLAVAGPQIPPNTSVMLFSGADDDALLGVLRDEQLLAPDARIRRDDDVGGTFPRIREGVETAPSESTKQALTAALCLVIAVSLTAAPFVMRVNSDLGVWGVSLLFWLTGGALLWELRARRRARRRDLRYR